MKKQYITPRIVISTFTIDSEMLTVSVAAYTKITGATNTRTEIFHGQYAETMDESFEIGTKSHSLFDDE